MSPAPDSTDVLTCNGCGASVYREHLDRGLAGRWSGQLLCPHCLGERRKHDPALAAHTPDQERLSKADETEASAPAGRTGAGHTAFAAMADTDPESHGFKRPLNPDAQGASRLRVFHCKLADGPMAHMNHQINEWLDLHPDIRVKFATTSIGIWEGKHSEAHLIMTLYY